MTYYTKLIERLRDTPNWQRESYGDWKQGTVHYDRAPFEASDAIEALQAENELLKRNLDSAKDVLHQDQECILRAVAERDALQAKLDELQKQEPIYQFSTYTPNQWVDMTKEAYEKVKGSKDVRVVYAAPKALEPLERVAECAARLVEHADFQLGGILSADSRAKDIPSKAVSQVKSRHLAALRDSLASHGITKGTP